jgi:hypothetical protein
LGKDELSTRLDYVRVEASAQAAIGRHDDQERAATGGRPQKRMRIGIDTCRKAIEHLLHSLREWPRGDNSVLRAFQPRGGDHLHRLRDLLR